MPTKQQVAYHHSQIVTKRHAERLAAGRKESVPSDYMPLERDPDAARLRLARWEAEDRKMRRELGL